MLETYAKMLGYNTAGILSRITEGRNFQIQLSGLPPSEPPTCELAVSIDFDGFTDDDECKRVSGRMTCGAIRFADIRPLLTGIAAHLGLEAAILETEAGPQNILNEFLNIVIGQTGADWAEHGFEMNFSTPRALSGQALPIVNQEDQAFHVIVSDLAGIRVDIVLVFSDQSRPVA